MLKKIITREEKKAIPFILPGIIVSAILIVYPLLYIIRMSFSDNALTGGGFAGIQNYLRLFRNPQFLQVLMNTAKWTIATVFAAFVLGFMLASFINFKGVKLKEAWRSLAFIAWVIPGVVKATAWKWLYTSDGGMINHILMSLGITNESIPWLTNSRYALWSIIVVQIWATAPYVMLMMTAGLQQLPKDYYESADLDGANLFQKVFYITIPQLKDIIFICILMLFVWSVNEFSLIWIMTSGGQNTTTLSLLIYNQFKVLNLNAASASAVMQLILSMIFAGVYIKFVGKGE